MSTKKRIASPLMLAVCLIGIGMMAAACVYSVYAGVEILSDSGAGGAVGAYFGMAAVSGGFTLFFLWGMNSICCLVWVEDGILHRRGLLFGHRRCCAVNDIQRLEAVSTPRGGSWIYIVDSAPGVFENALKSSYICLENTTANRAFIASFCGRMIRPRQP